MRIIVDADACPGKNIIESVAKKYNIEVIMYCDLNHIIESNYSKIIYVDSGFQSVDMKIVNEVKKGDIIITQDFGVGAMCLGKFAYALSPKGYIYSEDNINKLLFERHISSKVRRAGGKCSNAKKRNKDDDSRLRANLEKIIKVNIKNH